jgi:mercuric ion transport protein
MQTATKQLWAGVLAAIVGSLCCVAPLLLLTLGISGAWISRLTALEPYRPIFIGVMLAFVGLAFRRLYITPAQCAPEEACANPRLHACFVPIDRSPVRRSKNNATAVISSQR